MILQPILPNFLNSLSHFSPSFSFTLCSFDHFSSVQNCAFRHSQLREAMWRCITSWGWKRCFLSYCVFSQSSLLAL